MTVGVSLDRSSPRFADKPRQAIIADLRRIAVVGARGWIGQTALTLLDEALGHDAFDARVVCFGSQDGTIRLESGREIPQRALSEIGELDERPTLLLHLAFLTKDKVAGMDAEAYTQANHALSGRLHDALDKIGVDRLFVASSGAAAFADDPKAAEDLKLYGRLKREDEELFQRWAERAPLKRRAAIGRIYSVSGPFMNKHGTYALASFILDALAGNPIEVRAPMPVLRSYVAVRELLSFVFADLLTDLDGSVLHFETGGKALELGEVAACTATTLGGTVVRRPIISDEANRYVGDHAAWSELIGRHGIAHMPLAEQIAETAAWFARITPEYPE